MTKVSRKFYIALARAAGGSLLFTLPMLMTMEMWSLGFLMDPFRLALMLVVSIPILAGLAYFSGFEKRISITGAVVDSMVAIAVGAICAAGTLTIFGIIHTDLSLQEVIGKITIQTIPGAIGAVLASSQMGGGDEDKIQEEGGAEGKSRSYWGELFIMLAGALFFAFNMAPTEEMLVIAHAMSAWHSVALVIVSVIVIHAFVYSVDFRGQETRPYHHSWWAAFSRFTIVGYAIAFAVSFYCLWSFGRNDGNDASMILSQVVVLAFPAAVGSAAGRLII